MFLDASAAVAILNEEPNSGKLLTLLNHHRSQIFYSPIVQYEAILGLARATQKTPNNHTHILGLSRQVVGKFLRHLSAQLRVLGENELEIALDAFAKYGRGSGHAAKLNMGDCFAYAMAKSLNVPLLYVGNDFIHTDINSAIVL